MSVNNEMWCIISSLSKKPLLEDFLGVIFGFTHHSFLLNIFRTWRSPFKRKKPTTLQRKETYKTANAYLATLVIFVWNFTPRGRRNSPRNIINGWLATKRWGMLAFAATLLFCFLLITVFLCSHVMVINQLVHGHGGDCTISFKRCDDRGCLWWKRP